MKISISPDVLHSRLGSEIVLLHVTRGVYFSLNETGARIWIALEESTSLADICRAVGRDFDVAPDSCAADVRSFIDQLAQDDLIELIE